MQIIHATFASGEGEEAVELIENLGMEVEDYKLIESDSGDLLIINLLYDKVDIIIDKLKGKFDFTNNVHRSLMIFTPDTIIPRNKEKVDQESYRSARETIINYARDNSEVSLQLIFLALVAAIITSLGLIINNTPVIVGSMIIAPVFGPIAAMAIGIVLGDLKLLGRGFLAEMTVVGIAVSVGAIFGLIIPNVAVNHALKVRMLPTLPDLLIALAAGGAGAYSLIKNVKSQQLVGVVIAAALIPVMATIGIGISLGNLNLIVGATLLLLGNFFALLLAIILVFYYQGLKPQWWYASTAKKLIKRSLIILTVSVIILTLPLSAITYQQMIKEKPEDIVRKVYRQQFSDQLENRLVSIEIKPKSKEILLVLYSSQETSSTYFKFLTNEIKNKLGTDYNVIFEVIPTKIIRPTVSIEQ
ncbi:putative hydrophobic protein (TIGR00341 family) [Halanaerobacter jeridensis]|uniref:Hydrophobic protein (TIGR00341 family) n=1 Tax=Halanaerobacter jeridensis TaxID=706427 RepID=A0A938XRM8_9FIRM|nr:putative hydrophobic protein (TIGR00341 family) [Halanaerobacter jeridensis]